MSTPVLSKTDSLQFSPIEVRESPVKSTPQKGNLTGNARKIRDSAADIYNLVQEWKTENVKGYDVLKKINSLKISSMKESSSSSDPEKIYPEGLQSMCDELNNICEAMFNLDEQYWASVTIERMLLAKRLSVEKMAACRTEMAAVVRLEALRGESAPPFVTWPTFRFGEAWSEITSAYEKEFELKVYIKENAAHAESENTLTFYLACWAHEPCIQRSVDLTLEALLKETGHR